MKKQLALEYLLGRPWAVDSSLMGIMGRLAARDIKGIDLSDLTIGENKIAAVMAKDGKAITPQLELRENGIAVLHIKGVISRYASMFDAICGGASTETIAKDFKIALDDPHIKGIVLNVDSPGGDAQGIHELSEMIFNARGTKPIIAYAGGTCASAGYWPATAADELVIDATAMVGSIGIVVGLTIHKDDDDIERLEFVSSQSPKKRLDPKSKEGAADWQSQLDQMADVFVSRVARNMV